MILNAKPETETLSPLRKAAMLLIVLGEQTQRSCCSSSPKTTSRRSAAKWPRITAISAEQAESVLNEFHHISTAGDYVARGGMDFARKLLMRAFGPDIAKRLLDRLTKALGAKRRPSTPSRKPTRSSSPSSSTTNIPRPSRWCSRTSTRRRPRRC